jgi:hypothetical protein
MELTSSKETLRMYRASRRNLLQSLLYLPAACAGTRFIPSEQDAPAATGSVNLHLRGPFSFLFFENPQRKEILIISPDPPNHHLPSMSSQYAETPVQRADYVLSGVTPTSKAQPDFAAPNVNRLTVDAKKLQMDTRGVIDPRRTLRFFSLSVPSPDWIVPWHPVAIKVTGKDSPYPTQVDLPVGYTFVYPNQTFAQVAVTCPSNIKDSWLPKLAPYPGQNSVDILVEMSSALDIDCNHATAMTAFSAECALYADINPGARLDLGLDYGPPPATCQSAAKALSKRKVSEKIPDIRFHPLTHTGTDCKAALLEIINVSDKVTLG